MTLAEIKENHCLDFLANTFGILHTDIEKDFATLDKNGDGVVSIGEGLNAFKTFGINLDRSPKMQKELGVQMILADMESFDDAVHGSWKFASSYGYKKTEKDTILAVATAKRYDHIKTKTYTWDTIKDFVVDLAQTLSEMGIKKLNCYLDNGNESYLYIYRKYAMFKLRDNTLSLLCWETVERDWLK